VNTSDSPDPLSTPSPTSPRQNGRGGFRIALLYNLASNAPALSGDAPPDSLDELDSQKNVEAYAAALRAAGHTVFPMEGDASLPARLKRNKIDICFNTCEGYRGDSREAQVPALLEMLGIPYTAARVLGLALTLDKAMTKRVLAYHGLPTPRFQEFFTPDDALDPTLRFPLFLKPNREGTGKGITSKSIVNDEAGLREYVAYLIKHYHQPVLVEQYVDGRDLTCGLVGNLEPKALNAPIPLAAMYPKDGQTGLDYAGVHFFPISEVDYTVYPPGTEPVYSNKLKIELADDYHGLCPAPIPEDTAAEIRRLTLEVFRRTQSLDMSRVDFRLDRRTRQPQILEINALPGITPISDLSLCAYAEGWTHADLVVAVMNAAISRLQLHPKANGKAATHSKRAHIVRGAHATLESSPAG
jgi:D-alanine-D-alanine ligase